MKVLPERGRIGIFNRSYYEEVLVVKVHQSFLDGQRLPVATYDNDFWAARYEDINAFERHLVRNGTVVLKFFLHISKDEQKRQLMERIEVQEKNWKFNIGDITERGHWEDYMQAYEDCLTATSTEWAPWYVIPMDKRMAGRALIADIITRTVEELQLEYPRLSAAQSEELAKGKALLEAETPSVSAALPGTGGKAGKKGKKKGAKNGK
jgi:polyphosphate kinase 2 (PPK2 family)